MHGLLMDDFRCHQIKMVTETNILEKKKQRGSIDYLGQRNGHRLWVLGNEEDSFLNWKTNITGKISRGILHKTQL